MLVYFGNQSWVVNLIYWKQLILLYWCIARFSNYALYTNFKTKRFYTTQLKTMPNCQGSKFFTNTYNCMNQSTPWPVNRKKCNHWTQQTMLPPCLLARSSTTQIWTHWISEFLWQTFTKITSQQSTIIGQMPRHQQLAWHNNILHIFTGVVRIYWQMTSFQTMQTQATQGARDLGKILSPLQKWTYQQLGWQAHH